MPLTMRQTTIWLLPKPGKDHSQMTNFRPISMLNNDYKMFAKIRNSQNAHGDRHFLIDPS